MHDSITKFCQSRIIILPKSSWTFKNTTKTFKIVPKWRYFSKSGHTDQSPPKRSICSRSNFPDLSSKYFSSSTKSNLTSILNDAVKPDKTRQRPFCLCLKANLFSQRTLTVGGKDHCTYIWSSVKLKTRCSKEYFCWYLYVLKLTIAVLRTVSVSYFEPCFKMFVPKQICSADLALSTCPVAYLIVKKTGQK